MVRAFGAANGFTSTGILLAAVFTVLGVLPVIALTGCYGRGRPHQVRPWFAPRRGNVLARASAIRSAARVGAPTLSDFDCFIG
jgi:hypothetical protein